jgi:hypothetical protein
VFSGTAKDSFGATEKWFAYPDSGPLYLDVCPLTFEGYCWDIEIGIGTALDTALDMRARLDFGARIWKEQIAAFPI